MITTMEALEYAISILNEQPNTDKNTKMIMILNKMKRRDVFIQWNEETIIERLMQFKEENGYAPTTTNLSEYGMPSSTTIQSHFHIKPAIFLRQLFPELCVEQPKTYKSLYEFETEEDWLNCFREQFNKHIKEDMKAKSYNLVRDANTPTWETIAKHCEVTNWGGLMKRAGVQYPNVTPTKHISSVSVHSPSLDKLTQINQERQRLNDELLEILSNKKHPI